PQRPKDFQLVAKILRLLPPFMQMVDRTCLDHFGAGLTTSSIDLPDALPHARPRVANVGPLAEAVERLLHGRIHRLEGLLLAKHLFPDLALLAKQFRSGLRKRPATRPSSSLSRGRVQCLYEDLGISHLCQRPGDITESDVLP